MIRRRKGTVDLGAIAQCPVKTGIVGNFLMQLRGTGRDSLLGINDRRQWFIVDLHGIRRILGEITIFGNHNGDAITDMAHFAYRQGRMGCSFDARRVKATGQTTNAIRREISARIDGDHAGHGEGGASVNPFDLGMGMGTAHNRGMQQARNLQVGNIFALALNKAWIFHALNALTNNSTHGLILLM